MDEGPAASGYADHLTDADLELLVSVATPATADRAASASWLRGNPGGLARLLADPRVFAAVFGHPGAGAERADPRGQAAPASPFLTFAVAVHRADTDLASMDHVPERCGPRGRVPLFDASELRDFLGSPARRFFLAELLASFTRVASGRYRIGGRGHQRTRRFSELDPIRLAGLLDAVPEAERPGVYRRLGDVALFLAGVFPDYAAAHAFGPVSATRLLRAAQLPAAQLGRLAEAPAIELLEHLGAQWYRTACGLAPVHTARLAVVAEVADRFRQARRVLNHMADGFIFPRNSGWSAPPTP